MPRTHQEPPPLTEWPAYWFLLLDNFLAHGELEAAAEAKRQLERLGVEVRYRLIPLARSSARERREVQSGR